MRLIDANALKDWLTKQTGFRANCEDCTSIDCVDCIVEKAIENAPTVDPVKHGVWIPVDELKDAFDCSECDVMVTRPYDYCPKCGAKMEELKDV